MQKVALRNFKTETEGRLGEYKYVHDYYVKADRGGDLVVVPPVPTATKMHLTSCTSRKSRLSGLARLGLTGPRSALGSGSSRK
jgi:hypothetical protein